MKKKLIPILCAVIFLLAGSFAGILVFHPDYLFPQEALLPVTLTEKAAQPASYDFTYTPLITTGTCYGDMDAVYTLLKTGQQQLKAGQTTPEALGSVIDEAITELGSFSQYYAYLDEICIEKDGVKYGAYTEEGSDPIGGGAGYSDIITTGDYIVTTADELYQALRYAEKGQVVYIPGGTFIDLTELLAQRVGFNAKPGVVIASNRGYINPDGSVETGAVVYNGSNSAIVFSLMEGCRVTGLVLQGPNPVRHVEHHTRAFYSGRSNSSDYFYGNWFVSTCGIVVNGNDVRIDNCEISGFGKAAIYLSSDMKGLLVDHCYIHHNQTKGLGYGVMHHDGTESIVEYCLFNYNRHSIAATGSPTTGYIARYNIEMGDSLSHCFDIHGGADRGDGNDIAGTYCEMYNNTFLSSEYPYWLRGLPQKYQKFYHNNCLYPYDTYDKDRLEGDRVEIYDNIFGIDTQTLVP